MRKGSRHQEEVPKVRWADISKETFRVSCLEPVLDGGNSPLIAERVIPAGGEERLYSHTTLCAHGHGMTLKEMNKNLLKKGLPYIKIDYCKYCYNHNTIGVLDEGDRGISKVFGGVILGPRETESGLYEFRRIPEKYIKRDATDAGLR